MPYKALSPLLGLRRREESYPGIDPVYSGVPSSTWQPASSPFMSRAPRDYETAIADSPVKHAMINAPFLKLRRRTESLLDTITGGTLPAEVLEAERRQKELDRQLKCRGCRVVFGSESGLNGHLRLFPAHVNPPEYKRKPRKKKSSRARRSHSTSDVASSGASITSSHRSTTPKATATHRHGRSATVSIPPSNSQIASLYPTVTAPATFQEALEAAEERAYYGVRPSPPRDLPNIPMVQSEWRVVNPDRPDTPEPPVVAPALPPLDFGSFQEISSSGAREQPLARPLPRKADTVAPLIDHEGRNVRAGEYAAIREMARRQEEHIRRSRPEQVVALPTGLGGVVKAVMATGATGASGRAVVPDLPLERETPIFVMSSKESAKQPKSMLKVQSPVALSSEDVVVVKPVMVNTGTTSFTTSPSPVEYENDKENKNEAAPPSNNTPPRQRILPRRRSTNPFLDEAFMHSYSSSASTAKTPPLSPSSPFASRYSAGNPFARMMRDSSDVEDNGEEFADAPTTPPVDLSEVFQISSSSKGKSTTNTNPFFADIITPAANDDDEDEEEKGEEEEKEAIASEDVFLSESPQTIPRGVRFEAKAAMAAEDNPCCPSCHRAFLDLPGVLAHLDKSDCSSFDEPGSPTVLQAIVY